MNDLLAQNIKQEKIKILIKISSKLIGLNSVQEENGFLYVTITRKQDNTSFLLKIILPDNFPLEPGNYLFVNPQTKNDDSDKYWPQDNEQAFKIKNQTSRWICLAGTSAYKLHHNGMYDPNVHSLSTTVIHIYKQIIEVN